MIGKNKGFIFLLMVVILFSACRKQTLDPSPELAITENPISDPSTQTPVLLQDENGYPLSDPYLVPEDDSNSPYPNPYPDIAPTALGDYPYPEAQVTSPAVENPYPYPGTGKDPESLPPTESVLGSGGDPYPILAPTEALAAPAPTPTIAPLPIPTPIPIIVQKTLRATNPTDVKLDSDKIQVIMFFAYWSGTSKAMSPIILSLEEKYEDRMNFIYLDIDDPKNQLFKERLRYKFAPHFFLLDQNGETIEEWRDFVDVSEFQTAFDRALQNP